MLQGVSHGHGNSILEPAYPTSGGVLLDESDDEPIHSADDGADPWSLIPFADTFDYPVDLLPGAGACASKATSILSVHSLEASSISGGAF